MSIRFTGHRRLLTVVNKSGRPIFNVEVRERHRALEWLSIRRPKVPEGETTVRLGQEIDNRENVYLLFDDPAGKTWICNSDGRLEEAK